MYLIDNQLFKLIFYTIYVIEFHLFKGFLFPQMSVAIMTSSIYSFLSFK
jgi:hypothetical protein